MTTTVIFRPDGSETHIHQRPRPDLPPQCPAIKLHHTRLLGHCDLPEGHPGNHREISWDASTEWQPA